MNLVALDELAWEYRQAAADYRRVCKGAELRRRGDGYGAFADERTEKQLQSLDRRLQAYAGPLSPFGSAAWTAGSIGQDQEASIDVMTAPFLNAEHEQIAEDLFFKHDRFIVGAPNHLPGRLHIRQVREAFRIFDSEILEALGLAPDELLGSIWAIAELYEMMAIENFDSRISICSGGTSCCRASGVKPRARSDFRGLRLLLLGSPGHSY